MTLILDTCALLFWTLQPRRLTPPAARALEGLLAGSRGIVSSASFWEIALKVKADRLDIGVTAAEFHARVRRLPVEIEPVDTALWLDSVALDWTHRDPVDRLVVALAKRHRATVVTSDRAILDRVEHSAW